MDEIKGRGAPLGGRFFDAVGIGAVLAVIPEG